MGLKTHIEMSARIRAVATQLILNASTKNAQGEMFFAFPPP